MHLPALLSTSLLLSVSSLAYPTDSVSFNNDTLVPRSNVCDKEPWIGTSDPKDLKCEVLLKSNSHDRPKMHFSRGHPTTPCELFNRAPNRNVMISWGDCGFAVDHVDFYEDEKCKVKVDTFGGGTLNGPTICHNMSGVGGTWRSFKGVRWQSAEEIGRG